jgi:hypothetical protein
MEEGVKGRLYGGRDPLPLARSTPYVYHRLAKQPEISEQTIMSLAGHESRAMLARYSHICSQAKQEAIAALERTASIAVSATDSPHSRISH